MKLREMQERFAQAMLSGEGAALFPAIHSSGVTAEERLGVYENNVVGSLSVALADTFEACERLVGEDFFSAMAGAYVRAYPPQEAPLFRYGADFADFTANYAPARELAYLADLARFDWAWNEVYHAADDAPVAPEALAACAAADPEHIRLRFRACARLLASAWPVDRIFTFCMLPPDSKEMLDINKMETAHLLLWRDGVEVRHRRIAAPVYGIVKALMEGRTLAEACGEAEAPVLEEAFGLMLSLGLVAEIMEREGKPC